MADEENMPDDEANELLEAQRQREEQQSKIISSGNTEIDRKMGGGIPTGSLCIIDGNNDSGKSVLTQQLTWGALRDNKSILMLTTENTSKSLLKQMESLALDIRDQFILGKIRAYAVHESMLDKECETTADEIAAKKTILHTILDYIESSPEKIIIIDSLTVFVSNMDEKEVIGFFTSCKKLCDNGNSIIITVHNYAFNDDVMTRIISICDAHLHMNTENAGEQIVKTMEVSKIRGAQLTTGNVVSFDVKPNFGFKIIPISKAKA